MATWIKLLNSFEVNVTVHVSVWLTVSCSFLQ